MSLDKIRAATAALTTPPPAPAPAPSPVAPAPETFIYDHIPPGTPDPAGALAWCLRTIPTGKAGPCPPPGRNGRNTWLTALAKMCNDAGVPLADLLTWAESAPELAGHNKAERPHRIADTVRGIYRTDAVKHGRKPYTAPQPLFKGSEKSNFARRPAAVGAPLMAESEPADPLPLIPAAVYAGLPDFLQAACQPFAGPERDMFLTAALGVLSGCFPAVETFYDGTWYGLNLYTFTTARAASGKGVVKWARRLAEDYHREERDAYRLDFARYTEERRTWEELTTPRKGKGGPSSTPTAAPPEPEEPPRRGLFLPANTSAAALIKLLAQSEGERGVMCETEADGLADTFKQDWGNCSTLLRCGSEDEPYAYVRKTGGRNGGGEHYEMQRPRLALALAGTPNQVQALIGTAENGLFSRFYFYYFDGATTFRDPSPSGPRGDLAAYFDPLARRLTALIRATTDARVNLTPGQWARINEAGPAVLTDGEGDAAALRGLRNVVRLAGLLTVLRCLDTGEAPAGALTCADEDATAALALAAVYRAHTFRILEALPRPAGLSGLSSQFAQRAATFTEAARLRAAGYSLRAIANALGVPKSTVSDWFRA